MGAAGHRPGDVARRALVALVALVVMVAMVTMVQQAGVPSDRIFFYDGSRQSNIFTAKVAGLAGTARIFRG